MKIDKTNYLGKKKKYVFIQEENLKAKQNTS